MPRKKKKKLPSHRAGLLRLWFLLLFSWHGSSPRLFLSFFQREIVGRLTEAVVLLHDDLVFLSKKTDLHLPPGLSGKTSPLDEFFDDCLLHVFGDGGRPEHRSE